MMRLRAWMVFPLGALLAAAAWSQATGPGMMGGRGQGPGMMGGYGTGPGMMGGYGMGPGMMGGGNGCPGMMGGGYGMGPGMMGGYGGNRWGNFIPDMTDEQRGKVDAIEKSFRQKQWQLMGKMYEMGDQPDGYTGDGKLDEQAALKAFDAREALRKKMFENMLDERKQIDAILTPQQREQLRRGWGRP